MARSGRAAWVVVSIVFMIVALSRRKSAPYSGNDGSSSESADPIDSQVVRSAADSTRYVYKAQVDEGLGVSLDIVLDNSGSMDAEAKGDTRPKYIVAREALERMLDATDSAIAKHPDFPVKIAIHVFSSQVETVMPIQPYNRDSVRAALARVPAPNGGTAIGRALSAARQELYRSGTFRKNMLVLTDGENTSGPSPRDVAHEIFERSEGGVRMFFVAFDVDATTFDFVQDVKGETVGAANGAALTQALDRLYQGKVLAEAMNVEPPNIDSTRKPKP